MMKLYQNLTDLLFLISGVIDTAAEAGGRFPVCIPETRVGVET